MSKRNLFKMDTLLKKNQHPLEAAAFLSGQTQFDIIAGKQYDSNTEDKILWSKIITPIKEDDYNKYKQLPEYLKINSERKDLVANSRNCLWKDVYNREIRIDAQFARKFTLPIPYFLTVNESAKLIEKFSELLVDDGMIVDAAIHNHNNIPNTSLYEHMLFRDTQQNKRKKTVQDNTAYLLCTLRDYENGIFVNKNRSWNHKSKLFEWRKHWTKCLLKSINNSANATEEEKEYWSNKIAKYKHNDSLSDNEEFDLSISLPIENNDTTEKPRRRVRP